MKLLSKIILGFSLLVLIFFSTFSYSCKKDSSSTKVDSIKTSDANGLQSVITIPNGSISSGTLPATSTSLNKPAINSYQTSASISSGYQILLPFQYTSANGWKYIYLQISGATNGYFVITNPSSSANSGTIVLPITIPGQVLDGDFTITFSVVDVNGLISTYVETLIVIKDPLTCTDGYNSGYEGLTFSHIDLGTKSGTSSLIYDTYSVPDRIDIFQGSTWLGGTGTNPGSTVPPICNCSSPLPGFIGATGTITFNYNPSNGRIITVVVSGCLGSGTAWEWQLTCP